MSHKAGTVLKVKSTSNPIKVAGSIAGAMREHGTCAIMTIGAGALNQEVKAIAIATVFLKEDGIELVARPVFKDLTVEDAERTAVMMILEHRVEDPNRPIPKIEFVVENEAPERPKPSVPPSGSGLASPRTPRPRPVAANSATPGGYKPYFRKKV